MAFYPVVLVQSDIGYLTSQKLCVYDDNGNLVEGDESTEE